MEYKDALLQLEKCAHFGINLGLQRISSLLGIFGNPQDDVPVIHIGGTNGKGSTLAMISSVLREAGYRVGAFTSPHLISYRERFMINGECIPRDTFAGILKEIMKVVERVHQETGEYPTEFEILTALAFIYFARSKVDVLLLEVGMGGDIDSTNIVKKPLLSIITNVALDHMDYLGKTLEEIAQKKSGIIKEHCPVITAAKEDGVLRIIREKAQIMQAPFFEASKMSKWEFKKETPEGQIVLLSTHNYNYGELFIPFWGPHQIENAVTAIAALEILKELDCKIEYSTIGAGIARAKWPGRLEVMGKEPLLVLDGAHNPAGMEVISRWLAEKRKEFKRVILLIGMLDDKDRSFAGNYLETLVDMVVLTKPNSYRAKKWYELGQEFHRRNAPIFFIENPREALQKAQKEAGTEDMLLVTGSLYLVGEIRKIIIGQK